MDKSLISEINVIRNDTFNSNYKKAKDELKRQAMEDPLRIEFRLFESEPITTEMAELVSNKLKLDNKCNVEVSTGFFSWKSTLLVKLPLPDNMTIKEEVKEEVKEEAKEEVKEEI